MGLLRTLKIFAPLLMMFVVSSGFAAEPPTGEALQQCRAALSSEKNAIVIDRWSTKPLPHNYRQVAESDLRNETVSGWTVHQNPNRTLTVVIHRLDQETEESSFLILLKDKGLASKHTVYAFEFALSSREKDGVTGLFFCDKRGPSAEWIWNKDDWKTTKIGVRTR